MKGLFLLASLVAGVSVAWLTIWGGIWYIAPFFLVGAAYVSIALDKATRWRIAAFSLGMIAVYGVETSAFVQDVTAKDARAKQRILTEPTPTPRPPRGGLLG